MMRFLPPTFLRSACLLALVACGENQPPPPLSANASTATADLTAKLRVEPRTSSGTSPRWSVERTVNDTSTLVRQAFAAHELEASGLEGVFIYKVALTSRGLPGSTQLDRDLLTIEGARLPALDASALETLPNRLLQDDRELTYVTWTKDLDFANDLKPGMFSTVAGVIYLVPFLPSEGSTFEFLGRFEEERESEQAGGHVRVDIGASSFHGVGVFSGDSLSCQINYEEGAELLFSTSARGASGAQIGFTILVDDTVVWSRQLSPTDEYGAIESWRIELPGDASKTAAKLSMRCPLPEEGKEGDFGLVHVLAPSIERMDLQEPRPDIVLFLADTFRADNLALSGGNPRFAPHLNAFAEESVYFDSAWSPSSWTLPSQASMLTGVHPARHGAVVDLISLDDRMETIPEVLGRAGYRTVAVTEGGFVVPAFGMDQGFETFLVGAPLDIEGTLARVRRVLAVDDGRPLFLFVHTFRAHSNYIATELAMADLPELFGSVPEPEKWNFDTLLDELFESFGKDALDTPGANGRLSDAIAHNATMDNMARLYRGGSNDTDRGFGEFLKILEHAGLGNAPTIFTSDHGEAFGEHNIYGHANSTYEETVHIPMAIRAPGMKPRVTSAAASLLDLGPTICELANVPAPAIWEGISLVELLREETPNAQDRRLFSFECPSKTDDLPAEFTLREGPHKLMGSLDGQGELIAGSLIGFDLERDPGESNGIPFSEATPWMRKIAAGVEIELKALQVTLHPPRTVTLSAEEAERLQAMGYLGK